MNNFLYFDVETTGLPPKGAKYDVDFMQFPHIVQIAWIFKDELKSYIIKPVGYEIPEEVSNIHGITTAFALEHGVDFQKTIIEFLSDCMEAEKLIAHNIYFDTSIIKANLFRIGVNEIVYKATVEPALDKEKRFDTMMKTINYVQAPYPSGRKGFKFPTLQELYQKLFNSQFENPHNASNDVKALQLCFDALSDRKLIEL